MSKKVLLIAGVLLAAGSVAALSAPHFRGGAYAPRLRMARCSARRRRPVRPLAGALRRAPEGDGCQQGRRRHARGVSGPPRPDLRPLRQEQRRRRRSLPSSRRAPRRAPTIGSSASSSASMPTATAGSPRRSSPRRAGSASPCATSTATAASASTTWRPGMRERVRRWRADRGKDAQDSKDGKEAGTEAKERAPLQLDRLLGRTDRQFGRLDKNGDGFIDAKDLEPLAAERVAFASKRFFRRFDADGDGKVTQGRVQSLRQGALRQPRSRRRRQDHGCRPAADDARTRPFEVSSRIGNESTTLARHRRAGAQKRVRTAPAVRTRRQRRRDGAARARGGGRGGGFSRPRRPASADRARRGPAHAERRCGGRGRGAGDAVAALAQCRRLWSWAQAVCGHG